MNKDNSPLTSFVVVLFCIILIDALGWGIVYPIFDPIILKNSTGILGEHASVASCNFWYEAMVGIYCICLFFAAPVLGALSDYYGRKPILTIALVGNGLGFILSGVGVIFNNFVCIIIGRIISGSTAGSLPIAQAAMMDICDLQTKKAKYLSLSSLANVSGFAIGPLLGAFILDKTIWREHTSILTPFIVVIIVIVLGLIGLTLCYNASFKSSSNMLRVNNTLDLSIVSRLYNISLLKKTSHLAITFTAFMLAWVIFFSLEPLLLVERFGWSASLEGYFIGFSAVCLGLGVVFIMPWLSKRFSLNNIIQYSLITMLCCSIMFPLIRHVSWLWVLVVTNISVPFIYIALATLFSNTVSVYEQGTIMGIISSLFAFTWGIGPILVGLLPSIWLSYALASCLFLFSLIYFNAFCTIKKH